MPKYSIIVLFIILLAFGCSKEKSDDILLAIDKKTLDENINYDKIIFYKFAKIAIRSSAVQDTTTPAYKNFSGHLETITKTLNKADTNVIKNISVIDALLMYKDYRAVKGFVKETNEDIFPTLIEGINSIYGDRKQNFTLLKNENKIQAQNLEHAVLSMIVLATRDLGQPFALYECSKTQPELLPDHEVKTLLEFVRGFLFFSNRLYYLSEDGISRNITWLDKNDNIPLPYTKAFFGWRNLNDSQTHNAFLSMNYLFRGLDRLMMDRKVDEERALDDFEKFIDGTKKLGLENELTLAVESYLYLKREDKDKAIVALTKLNKSPLLTNSEHEALEQSIIYVNERKTDKVLNSVYDKVFLSKIATKYMLSVLARINWEKVLKENKVPHTDEIFATINKVKQISNSVSDYTNRKTIETGKTDLEKKSSELLKDAKNLLNR